MWPFKSRISVDERVLVWVRGRGDGFAVDICDGLKISSGTVYPALIRLEKRGALVSFWQGDAPYEPGKLPRRVYRVTVVGNGILENSSVVAALSEQPQ